MIHYIPRLVSFILGVFFFSASIFTVQSFAEVVDKVVAVVNDDIITLSELEAESAGLIQKLALETSGQKLIDAMEEAREAALESMIDQRLIQQRAKEINVSVADKEVEDAYQRTRNKVRLEPDEFIAKLKQSGMTEQNYRNRLYASILQSKLLSLDVRSKIVITDEMVLNYYEANYTSKVDENSYYLLQMGFSWDASLTDQSLKAAKNKAFDTAQRIKMLVSKGQNFNELARKFSDLPSASDGGDIGLFTLDEMAESMRNAISELNPGEVSKIVELGTSYQFFKILPGDKNAIVVTETYDSVKEEIRKKLQNDKLQESYKDWVKNLKEKAYIQKL